MEEGASQTYDTPSSFGLFLSKVKDSDKPIKLFLIAKVVKVFYNVFLTFLRAFSKCILYYSGGYTIAIKPADEHFSQALVAIVLVIEFHLLFISFILPHIFVFWLIIAVSVLVGHREPFTGFSDRYTQRNIQSSSCP